LKVTYIYLIFEQFLPSLHLEVEPLQVASGVTIDPHEAVVLSFPHSNYTVEVAALEEGIEEEVIFGLPVLPAEGTVGELHVIGGLDVVVGEAEGLIIPRVVGVLVSRPQVAEFGLLPRLFEHPADEVVEAFTLENDGDWDREVQLGLPTNHSMHLYPVSRSERSE
jgi:hypothetical protein